MKNIFMTSKRGIAAILILCILFSFTATNVFATSTIEADTVLAEETMPELVPMMTDECDDENDYSQYNGLMYNSTNAALSKIGFSYSGSGRNVVLSDPSLYISFHQCGKDLCVFIDNIITGQQLCWFKVSRW